MTADALAVIHTYTTVLTWAERAWYAALGLAALAVIGLGYLACNRIGASFTRAQQTITDIQQTGEGES
ncbi:MULTISPECIES: hypothetical protein [unclassified Streptomyces]|uniref:hypothetical protein n=1 Tax=unclassified Streptomyces TaxID=2593676 RepID=UPI0013718CA3|nr:MULTISPECIES: hypothetical protein [unclassified Streptomyces]NEA03691.1 hypothetical protein [Streptomyces sp. SID10116]MYY79703.1 hypothetical protein [Streptomyces sp. SID335]MYZ12823.1 hypothetical protein [Streptomyces sp. SID337]NDZ91127.1 hypothetical protein [Streptomyces sp. SID10115]NEB43524.1 hypothetical protein [Streptomyces sp. SID339]